MDPRSHIATIRKKTFGIDDQLAEDLKKAIEYLSEGLYSKDVHFVFELIQNAEDNHYGEQVEPSLSFRLTPDNPTCTPGAEGALIVENNELGFLPENVEALCRVGHSTKVKQEGYIGEKGIGFKSVFQVTADPHVFSRGYAFRLPKTEPLTGLGYIVPVWVDCIPSVVNKAYTTIILPLKPGCFAELTSALRSVAPETILFLRKLKSLCIRIDGSYSCTVMKDDSMAPLVRLLCETVENDTIEPSPGELFWVKTLGFERPPEVVATKRDKIRERDMTIALPLSETGAPQGKVYAYLPVLTDSGLPFLVNADFLLTSSREGIKEDEPWNHWLRDCIAPCFVAAFREMLLHREFRYQAYRFLPLRSDRARSEFFQGVTAAIHAALKDTAVIVREHREELVTPEEANRADESFRELFSTPEPPSSFCQQRLVSAKIECFRPQLTELGVMSVTASDVLECLQNRQWFSKRPLEWFVRCYDYLRRLAIDANLAQRLRECPIVPIEGRQLSCDAEQPIYLAASKEDRTFLQTVPAMIKPPVAFLRPAFRSFVEEREELTVWMQDVLRVYSFSRANYCIDIVNRLQRDYTSIDALAIITGTRFLARFCDDTASITDMPIVLSGGSRSLLSTLKNTPAVAHVVMPEAMDPTLGWQHVFETEQDKSHLAVLSNRYIKDKTVAVERDVLRQFLRSLGITETPLPRQHLVSEWSTSEQSEYERQCFEGIRHERSTGEKTVENRLSPSWLSRLVRGKLRKDLERKTRALAAWLRRLANSTARTGEAWTEPTSSTSTVVARSGRYESQNSFGTSRPRHGSQRRLAPPFQRMYSFRTQP